MRERGDMSCHHEPFMYDYYVHRKIREMPYFEIEEDRPQSYQDIRNMLLRDAEDCDVFFKDMSYYVMPRILEDAEFSSRISNCFLIRNPVASILSYFKLDNEVTLDEIGLEAQWKHCQGLLDKGIEPIVIEAESVQNNPRQVLASAWERIGVSNEEKAFDWQDEKPADWGQVSGWHQDVLGSDGIAAVDPDALEKKRNEFKQLAEQNSKLRKYLDHHLPYYEKLKALALQLNL